ncbi:PH domain-containing protein [Corynebacterium sputi]|uniref:PH domain-containing protein n=1 Tax=Corynebacterium sputi TaxID=489915 RepID=UPI0004204C78|nr:PH domain-containing protein [Corynebacterium sputi]
MSVMPEQWSRLSSRIIWVDLVITALSLIPMLIALAIDTSATLWPLIGIAAFGILSAVLDAVRWVFTFYRITDSHIELRTGVLFRQHRSIPLDRIRSVDIEARLRHRLSGLRMINIGAGQQSTAGETAFTLDALSGDDAVALQQGLLSETPPDNDGILATFRPGWVVYNMFNIWAFLMAAGLIGGAWGITSLVGVDMFSLITGLYEWGSLSWTTIIAIIVIGVMLLGWIGLTVNYFTEFWNFELSRVPGPEGTQIRTRKGLFTTREVNRSENRIRGVQIAEPLLYRWLGVTDTHVITTGLDMSSMSDPAAVLPRTDGATARRVALEVIDEKDPLFDVPLTPHPTRALRRRLWWATLLTIPIAILVAMFAPQFLLATPAIWVLMLVLAWVAYRNLGHAIHGPYLIMRSGLLTRSTVILRRDAVSTIAETESVLQKRLGLRSLKVMTAAGHSAYDIPDVDVRASTDLAAKSAPGVLDEFIEVKEPPEPQPRGPQRRMPAPDLARGVMLLLIAMAYASVYVGAEFGVLVHEEPWWDQAATFISTLFLDNRAFPMFAILFGFGLALSVRRQQERGVDELEIRFSLRRRACMLLAIGLVHAILVYSGEILTSYALAIFVTGWMLFRPARVLTRGVIITAIIYLFTVTAGIMFLAYGRMSNTIAIAPGYATADDWIERIAAAPFLPFYLAISYPLFLLVIIGFIAGRLGLIKSPRLAAISIGISVLGALPSALIFVGVWQPSWIGEGVILALQVLTGVAGGVGYVAVFALYSDTIAKWWGAGAVMAVGKRSLTFYLLNSIIVAVVLNRDLLGLPTGALGAMGVAFGAWLISVGLAVLLERAGKQGPMEVLMRKAVQRGSAR